MNNQDILRSNPYDKKRSDEWAGWVESSDAEASREKEIYPIIRSWLAESSPANIVEIGCGQGIVSKQVPLDTEYIGIDASCTLIERAKQLYAGDSRSFLEGDAYELPIKHSSAEAVLSVWVWSHLQDLRLAAGEMARILKPNGTFLIVNANPATYDERKEFYKSYEIVDGVLVGDFDLGNNKILSQGTLHFHSIQDMTDALHNAGLSVDNIETLGHKDSYPDGLYIAIKGVKKAANKVVGSAD